MADSSVDPWAGLATPVTPPAAPSAQADPWAGLATPVTPPAAPSAQADPWAGQATPVASPVPTLSKDEVAAKMGRWGPMLRGEAAMTPTDAAEMTASGQFTPEQIQWAAGKSGLNDLYAQEQAKTPLQEGGDFLGGAVRGVGNIATLPFRVPAAYAGLSPGDAATRTLASVPEGASAVGAPLVGPVLHPLEFLKSLPATWPAQKIKAAYDYYKEKLTGQPTPPAGNDAREAWELDYLKTHAVPGFVPPSTTSRTQDMSEFLSGGKAENMPAPLGPVSEAVSLATALPAYEVGGALAGKLIPQAVRAAAPTLSSLVAAPSAADKAKSIQGAMNDAVKTATASAPPAASLDLTAAEIARLTPEELDALKPGSTIAQPDGTTRTVQAAHEPAVPGAVPPVIPSETAPALGIGDAALNAAGQATSSVGKAAQAVAAIPGKFADWVAEKITGQPEMADKIFGGGGVGPYVKWAILNHFAPWVGAVIGVVKGLEKTGAVAEGMGDLASKFATADPLDPFGRFAAIAADKTAPPWMQKMIQAPAFQAALKGGSLAKNTAVGVGKGLVQGTALGVLSGQDPEEIGETAGTMSAFGGLHGNISARDAKIFDSDLGRVSKYVHDYLGGGGNPDTLKLVNAADILQAARMPSLNPTSKIRFATANDPGTPMAPGGAAFGQAGLDDAPNNTFWIDPTKRAPGQTISHEETHFIQRNNLAANPDIKDTLDSALAANGQTIADFQKEYSNRVVQGQGVAPGPAADKASADYSAGRASTDPDWGYSEMLADSVAHNLEGKDLLQAMQGREVQESATQSALRGMDGWLSTKGVQLQRKPGTIFPNFSQAFNDPGVRRMTYKLLKTQRESLLGKAPAESAGRGLTAADMGTKTAPFYKTAAGQQINPYGQLIDDGKGGKKFVAWPASEVRKRALAESKARRKYFPEGQMVTAMPAGLEADPDIAPWTKAALRGMFDSLQNKNKLSLWYHRLNSENSATSDQGWAADARRSLGNTKVSYQSGKPLGVEMTKKGNLIARWESEEAENQKLADWASRHGDLSLDLWGSDQAKAKADIQTYLQNHATGQPGESNGIGTAKRDVLNALLAGGNKEFEEKNPLRAKIRGKDRAGVMRSLRLDRMESVAPETSERPPANWDSLKRNLSPGEFSPSADPRAIKSAAVRDEETGKIYAGSIHAEALGKYLNDPQRDKAGKVTDGFTTNAGEFLDRNKAYNRAVELKQYQADSRDEGELEARQLRAGGRLGSSEAWPYSPAAKKDYKLDRATEYWLDKNGKLHPAPQGHAVWALRTHKEIEDSLRYTGNHDDDADSNAVIVYNEMAKKGYLRVIKQADRVFAQNPSNTLNGGTTRPTKAQRETLENVSIARNQPIQSEMDKTLIDLSKNPSDEFSPSAEPNAIKSAAVQDKETGKIFPGASHIGARRKSPKSGDALIDGYVTNSGKFVERDEALKLAVAAKQYKPSDEDYNVNKILYGLTSERFNKQVPGAATAGQYAAPIEGKPKRRAYSPAAGPRQPDEGIRKHAAGYMEEQGREHAPFTGYAPLNEDFGKHLRDEAGNIPKKGEPGHITPQERPYAEQKNIALPDDLTKEALGDKSGSFSPSAEDKDTPNFYSQLAKVVDEKFSGDKMPAAQLAALLRNPANGVKADELKWSGLDDFLKGKPRVTKEEVQNYLKSQDLTPQEIVKHGEEFTPQWDEEEREDDRQVWRLSDQHYSDNSNVYVEKRILGLGPRKGEAVFDVHARYRRLPYSSTDTLEAAKERAEELYVDDRSNQGDTEYHKYTLPGPKQNYKEILFKLPVSADRPDFESGHWGEHKNVVAHARVDDRTNTDGKPGLFVEEVQSDWHQEGRKKGYQENIVNIDRKAYEDAIYTARKTYEDTVAPGREALNKAKLTGTSKTLDEAYAKYDAIADPARKVRETAIEEAERLYVPPGASLPENDTRVPDAPFKTTWHETVFRRLVQMAAQSGKNWIGWTTGKQQAGRYSLEKHLDGVMWQEEGGDLRVKKKGENRYDYIAHVPAEKLPDYIGKETANKLVSTEKAENGYRYLSGLDLKVGGEGMAGFYDKMLVDYANKFGKKFGSKVGTSHLGMESSIFSEANPGIHTLPITPEMAASVKKGVPLFSPSADTLSPEFRKLAKKAGYPSAQEAIHFAAALHKSPEAQEQYPEAWKALSNTLPTRAGDEKKFRSLDTLRREYDLPPDTIDYLAQEVGGKIRLSDARKIHEGFNAKGKTLGSVFANNGPVRLDKAAQALEQFGVTGGEDLLERVEKDATARDEFWRSHVKNTRPPKSFEQQEYEAAQPFSPAAHPQTLDRAGMKKWLLDNKAWDSVGALDAKGAWWIARKAKNWQLAQVPTDLFEHSLDDKSHAAPGQPIVAYIDKDGEWEVLDGQHRVSEALENKVKMLPAYIPAQDNKPFNFSPAADEKNLTPSKSGVKSGNMENKTLDYPMEMQPGKAGGKLPGLQAAPYGTKLLYQRQMLKAMAPLFAAFGINPGATVKSSYQNSTGETEHNPMTTVSLPADKAKLFALLHGHFADQEAVAGGYSETSPGNWEPTHPHNFSEKPAPGQTWADKLKEAGPEAQALFAKLEPVVGPAVAAVNEKWENKLSKK